MHLDHLPGSFFGPSNLVDLLQHRALHQAQDRAFTYLVDGESEQIHLTNAQLDEQARVIAAKLVSMGLTGERALLLYPAGLDFIAAFFGCLYAGVVAVPAYPPRRNRSLSRIQAIVDDAQARVALTTAPVFERVIPLLDQTPDLKKVAWVSTDELPLELAREWREPDVHGDTLAFLQYTSGSTGIPEGRDADARQFDAQFGADRLRLRAHAQRCRRVLAAELSRHGIDRRHSAAALHRSDEHAVFADVVFAAAVSLAAGDFALSLHDQRRAELCLRLVRREGHARTTGHARPEQLAAGVQRRRAGAGRNARPFYQGVRAVRFPPRGVLSLLRHGRIDVDHHRRLQECAAGGPLVRHQGAGKQPGGRRRRR